MTFIEKNSKVMWKQNAIFHILLHSW